MQIETDGLVIMERQVGESDRLITVLTREEGVLRAFARKAKLLRSSKLSATQLLCYSRFLIYKGRDKYIIDDAQPVEVFFDLRRDIGSLSLAQYFCELAGALAPQEAEAGDFCVCFCGRFTIYRRGPGRICSSKRRWRCGCCPWRAICRTWSAVPAVPVTRRRPCCFCRAAASSIANRVIPRGRSRRCRFPPAR